MGGEHRHALIFGVYYHPEKSKLLPDTKDE